MVPQNNYRVILMIIHLITNHHNKYKNEKVWNTARITKMWHRDMKWGDAIGKMVPIDLPEAALPQMFNLFKKKCSIWESAMKHSARKWGAPVLQLDAVTDWDFGLSFWRRVGESSWFCMVKDWFLAWFPAETAWHSMRMLLCCSARFPSQRLPLLPCCFETGPHD